MKTEEMKGHLLARKTNLENHGRNMTAKMLQMEKQLQEIRGEVAATEGAVLELQRTIELLDGKEPAP